MGSADDLDTITSTGAQTPISTRLGSVRVVVTSNAEQYRMVDISGAPSGSAIRERLLSKLCIPDENQTGFSIFPTEIGSYGIGGALSDSRLFELCRDYGDPSASLKFFVSPYPDRPASQSGGYVPV
ncbi:hypothetical protein H2248_003028 [Termitomyces sp. 'cryptogamus']|nr:hypothetical protein H2248_003028 [Termitomyces sp. 'cryptogamus']